MGVSLEVILTLLVVPTTLHFTAMKVWNLKLNKLFFP